MAALGTGGHQVSGCCSSIPMQAGDAAHYPACTVGKEQGTPLPRPQSLGPSRGDAVVNSSAAACLQACEFPREVPGWQWALTRGGEAELTGTTGNRVPREPGERDMGCRSHGGTWDLQGA